MSDCPENYDDWYDNGPGSEAFKRRINQRKFDFTSPFIMRYAVEKELHFLRWLFPLIGPKSMSDIKSKYMEETGRKIPDVKEINYEDS